jgi:hypothetical protein
MHNRKSSNHYSLAILVLILFLLLLSACSTKIQNPPEIPATVTLTAFPTHTPQPSPTSTPTITPEPTATPRPQFDLHNPATWPQEMQDYFNRAPEEWINPSRSYISDDQFTEFFQQARKDFVNQQGVEIAKKSENEIFLEYQKWCFEHSQVMVWSPKEITQVVGGPFRISWIDGTAGDAPVHGGNNRSANLRINPETEGLIAQLLAKHMYSVQIFGDILNLTPNAGFMGINAGLVRIPGLDPQREVLLYLTYKEDNLIYDNLISIPLQPTIHEIGESILDGHQTIIEVSSSFTLSPAIHGLCSGGQDFCLNGRKMPYLSIQDLFHGLGLTTLVHPYYASPSDRAELNSIGDLNPYNIERGYAVGFFPELMLVDVSLPWQTR